MQFTAPEPPTAASVRCPPVRSVCVPERGEQDAVNAARARLELPRGIVTKALLQFLLAPARQHPAELGRSNARTGARERPSGAVRRAGGSGVSSRAGVGNRRGTLGGAQRQNLVAGRVTSAVLPLRRGE